MMNFRKWLFVNRLQPYFPIAARYVKCYSIGCIDAAELSDSSRGDFA